MPGKSPHNTTSDSLSDQEDFDNFDDFEEYVDHDELELHEDVYEEPYEPNEYEDSQKKRRELISILVQGDETALNDWLIKSNRSWKEEDIISDVLFLAVQLSSFPFLSLLFAKSFRELNISQVDDSPILTKELGLLTYHYNARNFTMPFNEFMQKALISLSNGIPTSQDTGLPELCSKRGIDLVFNTLFSWVEAAASEGKRFYNLIDKALEEDSTSRQSWSSYFWRSASRKEEINSYFLNHDVTTALALTFFNGTVSSTASEHLFLKIIREIKKDIKEDPSLEKEPGYALIIQFNEQDHKNLFFAHFHDAMMASRAKVEMNEPQKPLSQMPI